MITNINEFKKLNENVSKYFIETQYTDENGKLTQFLGSDGSMVFYNASNINNKFNMQLDRLQKLKNIKPFLFDSIITLKFVDNKDNVIAEKQFNLNKDKGYAYIDEKNIFNKINEEVINGEFYFYHSSKTFDAALYIIQKNQKTYQGMYGNGIYGQQYPDPTEARNNLSQSTIDRYKNMYGGSYRFKIKYKHPKKLFFLDLDAGKEVYPNYNVDKAIEILKEHNVPQNKIDKIIPYFSTRTNVPAISHSVFNTDTVDGGYLGEYGFDGLIYQGNQDGACALIQYPNRAELEVVEYSKNFGKTQIKYDSNNKQQVDSLIDEIQEKIKELSPVLNNRSTLKQQTGKLPSLDVKGKDRDLIRVIECGDKAGYDFKNLVTTGGDLNKFANLVQKQINASSEPKRTNRYNYAIQLLPQVKPYLSI